MFFGVGLLAPRPILSLEEQGITFVWVNNFDLSGTGGPTCSYANASIALRI